MLQHICSCGRIAEVRRRKNGQKLAYSHCVHCKGSNTSIEKSKEILASARENIGTKGDFFESSTQSETVSQTSTSKEFKPALEDLPEVLEPDIKKDEKAPKRSKVGTFFKVLLGGLVVGGLGVAGYKVSTNIKG